MTVIELVCIACSAGWAIALLTGIMFFLSCSVIRSHGGRTSAGVRALVALLLLAMVVGTVGCAVEDRVCEMAGR